MAECTSDTNFEDNVMRVTYVPISRVTPEVDQQEGTDASTQIEIDRTNASTSTRSSRTRRRSGSRGRDPHREYSRDREANGRDEFIDDTDYYAHERKRRKRSRNRSRPRSSSGTSFPVFPFFISIHAILNNYLEPVSPIEYRKVA